MNILKKGSTNNFWQLDLGSQQFQGDYPFLKEERAYGRFGLNLIDSDISARLRSSIPWDCEFKIGVFGLAKDVEMVFEQLKTLMSVSVDDEDFEDDTIQVSNPTRLVLYQVPCTELKVIIAGGDYCEPTPECNNIVANAKNVYAFDALSSLGDGDDDPIGDVIHSASCDPEFPEYLLPMVEYFKQSLGYYE